jgi:hypothetical protein
MEMNKSSTTSISLSHSELQQLFDRARMHVAKVGPFSDRRLSRSILITGLCLVCDPSSGSASTSITSTSPLILCGFKGGETGDGSWPEPVLRCDKVRLRRRGLSCACAFTRLITVLRARPKSDIAGTAARRFSMTRCSISRVSNSSVCSSGSSERFEPRGFTESICMSTIFCTTSSILG